MFPRFSARPLAAAVLALATTAALAGCAGSSTPTTTKPASDLKSVAVAGTAGQKPTLKLATPFSVTKTDRRVLSPGKGALVAVGERITIDYVGVNGTDGKEFDSTFSRQQSTSFTLGDTQIIKGFNAGLTGVTVGSRVLLAIPPKDAYGTQGSAAAGIGPTDTLVFVVDVKSANQVLKRAVGTAVKPAPGLPTVKLDKNGKPKITLPAGKPPAKLVVQPLIAGKGTKVVKGQTISVNYTGVIWPGGKQFDSSWDRGQPASFSIGVGKVIAGWDQGLVGQTVGSQVLLVIPPDQGYGAAGQPDAGIKGTDTLVFVVDILDAAS